jgi:hypothetical protein
MAIDLPTITIGARRAILVHMIPMKLERVGWRMRRFLPGVLNRAKYEPGAWPEPVAAVVHLLHSRHYAPSTPISQRLASALSDGGWFSFERLVKRVATELYEEELRKGAGVLDIGLFGSRLFNADVVRELKTANGILWEIESERKSL